MKICIDPGHGQKDSGAIGGGLREKDLALQAAIWLKEGIHQAVPFKHQFVWTRTTDTYPLLNARVDLARRTNCDLFLSIHANSAGNNPNPRGVEALVQKGDARSFELARRIIHTWRGLDPRVVFRQRIVIERPNPTQGGLAVLRGTWRHMPAVLLEIGFISNPQNRILMQDADYCLNLGRALARLL